MNTSARCSQCGHSWRTRKSPEDIDRPRCSECGAERDEISFGDEAVKSDDSADCDIVKTAKRERRSSELLKRVSDLLEQLGCTAPEESEHAVAREVQGVYRELESLHTQLSQSGTNYSLDELDAVRARLDNLEAEVEEFQTEKENAKTALQEAKKHKRNAQREYEELTEKNERLHKENANLTAENQQLAQELTEKQEKIDNLCGEMLPDTEFDSITTLAAAAREYRENQTRAKKLDREIAAKKRRIKTAEEVITECENHGLDIEDVLRMLQRTDDLERQKQMLQAQIDKCSEQKQELGDIIDSRKDQIARLDNEIQDKQSELASVETDITRAEQELQEARVEKDNVREKCDNLETAETILVECEKRGIDPEKVPEMLQLFTEIDLDSEVLAMAALQGQ